MTLVLREITNPPLSDDVALLYDLLNERPIWANISHDGVMPTLDEHYAFVASKGGGEYKHWWIIEERTNGQQPPFFVALGAIYMTKRSELGVAILSSKQNKGYATWAILKIVEMFPKLDLWANIAPSNDVSQQMFHGLGFHEVQRTYLLRATE